MVRRQLQSRRRGLVSRRGTLLTAPMAPFKVSVEKPGFCFVDSKGRNQRLGGPLPKREITPNKSGLEGTNNSKFSVPKAQKILKKINFSKEKVLTEDLAKFWSTSWFQTNLSTKGTVFPILKKNQRSCLEILRNFPKNGARKLLFLCILLIDFTKKPKSS